MTRLIFIRHGRTKTNITGSFTGRTDLPVVPESFDEMRRLAAEHPYPAVDAVYTSPLRRCRETAELFFPNHTAIALPGLAEVDFGDLEGENVLETFKEIGWERFEHYDPTLSFPNGEVLGDAIARAVGAIDAILSDARASGAQTIAVTTHLMLCGALLKHHASPSITREKFYFSNGYGIDVAVDPEQWRTERLMLFQGLLPAGAERTGW